MLVKGLQDPLILSQLKQDLLLLIKLCRLRGKKLRVNTCRGELGHRLRSLRHASQVDGMLATVC